MAAKKEQLNKAIEAKFKELQEAGFDIKDESPRFYGADNVNIKLPSIGFLRFDLSATDPSKMLVEMLKQAYDKGRQDGIDASDEDHLNSLIEAFPKLNAHIKSIAEDAAREAISDRLDNR